MTGGSAMMIDLIKAIIKKEFIDEAAETMKIQTLQTKEDEGCVLSHVFQSNADPAVFYMLIGWENPEAVEKHLNSEHDQKFREKMDEKMAAPIEMINWKLLV
jgi:quinol monooxygenase YgiN